RTAEGENYPRDLRTDHVRNMARKTVASQYLDDCAGPSRSEQFVEIITRRVRPEPLQNLCVAVAASLMDCCEAKKAIAVIAFAIVIGREIRVAEAHGRGMRIRTRPKTQHDALLVSLARVMYECDIQFFLHS